MVDVGVVISVFGMFFAFSVLSGSGGSSSGGSTERIEFLMCNGAHSVFLSLHSVAAPSLPSFPLSPFVSLLF